jgi:hypothetical protein
MRAVGDRLAARMRAMGQPWELAVFFWIPALVFAVVLAADMRFRSSLGDWEIFRHASRTVLHGSSPFAVLPDEAGRALVFLLTLACVPLALRLLGVRDWRCFGLALLTAPVLDSVSLGALSSVLLLGVAAAWRYRDRRHVAAATTAVTAVA